MNKTVACCPKCGSNNRRGKCTNYGDFACNDCGQEYTFGGRPALKHPQPGWQQQYPYYKMGEPA